MNPCIPLTEDKAAGAVTGRVWEALCRDEEYTSLGLRALFFTCYSV